MPREPTTVGILPKEMLATRRDMRAQQAIGQFGVDRFGQPLFFPAAHLTDEELGV